MFDIKCNIEDYYIQALDHTKEISFIKWLLLFKKKQEKNHFESPILLSKKIELDDVEKLLCFISFMIYS